MFNVLTGGNSRERSAEAGSGCCQTRDGRNEDKLWKSTKFK